MTTSEGLNLIANSVEKRGLTLPFARIDGQCMGWTYLQGYMNLMIRVLTVTPGILESCLPVYPQTSIIRIRFYRAVVAQLVEQLIRNQ